MSVTIYCKIFVKVVIIYRNPCISAHINIFYNIDSLICKHFWIIIHKFTDLDAVLREIEKKGVKAQEIILDEGQNPIVVTGNGQRISPDAKESGKGTGEN